MTNGCSKSLVLLDVLALAFSLLSVYSYAVYPLILIVLRPFFHKKVHKAETEPTVSVIIAAYNEEMKMGEKLDNTAKLEYPFAKLQVIVASDASTDGTEAIVRGYPQVSLLRAPERGGKERAQKIALNAATGEILVFTDVGTLLDTGAIRGIVRNFADVTVGAVSSRDQLISAQAENAEDLYVRYEMMLRRLESGFNGVVGLSGSFFAARREICTDWAEDLTSDFNTVFLARKKGLRAISDDAVVGYYRDIQKNQSEYKRKVRTLINGIDVFLRTLELLNVYKYGAFSWQLVSHKLMRWLVPFFLSALLAVTALGAWKGSVFCSVLFVLQVLFYACALLGAAWDGSRKWLPIKVAFYFSSVNLAIVLAWVGYFRGERMRIWNPTLR
jgi:cellulose synthase/poly-beta-1,6-N-acetylglucosamine synthase-like glycosyltransferase